MTAAGVTVRPPAHRPVTRVARLEHEVAIARCGDGGRELARPDQKWSVIGHRLDGGVQPARRVGLAAPAGRNWSCSGTTSSFGSVGRPQRPVVGGFEHPAAEERRRPSRPMPGMGDGQRRRRRRTTSRDQHRQAGRQRQPWPRCAAVTSSRSAAPSSCSPAGVADAAEVEPAARRRRAAESSANSADRSPRRHGAAVQRMGVAQHATASRPGRSGSDCSASRSMAVGGVQRRVAVSSATCRQTVPFPA